MIENWDYILEAITKIGFWIWLMVLTVQLGHIVLAALDYITIKIQIEEDGDDGEEDQEEHPVPPPSIRKPHRMPLN